jgi:hypothetical protein
VCYADQLPARVESRAQSFVVNTDSGCLLDKVSMLLCVYEPLTNKEQSNTLFI